MVKVRIKCISKDDEQHQKYTKTTAAKVDDKPLTTKRENAIHVIESDKIQREQHRDKFHSIRRSKSESNQTVPRLAKSLPHLAEKCKHNLKIEEQVKPAISVDDHAANEPIINDASRPRSKSVTSEPSGHVRTQSTLSGKSTASKSCMLHIITHTHDLLKILEIMD